MHVRLIQVYHHEYPLDNRANETDPDGLNGRDKDEEVENF